MLGSTRYAKCLPIISPHASHCIPMTKPPAHIRVEMSPFPAWAWTIYDADTGIAYKRLKDDAALSRWLARHPYEFTPV